MSLFKKKQVFNGHQFVNYLGLPGAGKTLSMVEENIIPAYLQGQVILSNFWLNLKGIKYFDREEDFLDFKNGVIAFDEIGQLLDPYNWKDLSFEVRRYFQNHRKNHVSIYSTTQDISFIAKPARVLISQFVFSENNSSDLFNFFLNFFNSKSLSFKQRHLAYADLYLLQKGLGGSSLVSESDLERESFSEDISFSEVESAKDIPVEKISYSIKKLYHRELNDFKLELVHYYCPLCCSRQLGVVSSEDTFKHFKIDSKGVYSSLKEVYCPAHPAQLLDVRESGIYDTDYLVIPPVPADLEFVPYTPSPFGYTKVRYKGFVPVDRKPKSL